MEFHKRFYRHRGITIIQKRDPALTRIRPGKVGLVLAGGAISGGAYKAGGLRALDELFKQRHTPGHGARRFSLTDSDIFVGLSAGSVLAAVLSAGVTPDEVLRITLGISETYEEFRRAQFMAPNWREPLERLLPFLAREQEVFTNWLSGATDAATGDSTTFGRALRKMIAALPSAFPTGLFSTHRLGAYVRRQMGRMAMPDDFGAAYARTKKELYLTAVDVNRGQMLVFGHDEAYGNVPISEAIQASCALPGWYRPVRVDNPRRAEAGEPPFFDLVDGGLVRTANVRVAVEKGADLVICYNPFTQIMYERPGRSLVDHGPYAYASQLFRILLGARLDLAKELLYRDETIDADIVFIEPAEDDYVFFRMNPLDHGTKDRAANHGYRSIRAAIQSNHERLAEVLATHGIEVHPPAADRGDLPGLGAEWSSTDMHETGQRRRHR